MDITSVTIVLAMALKFPSNKNFQTFLFLTSTIKCHIFGKSYVDLTVKEC